MVAVGILAMVMSFASVIFNVSVGSHRTALANAEVMQKLRAITDQLNVDSKGLQKDGYLILHCEVQNSRKEYQDSDPCDFRVDRIYYFCTGDFQSWFDQDVRSNIARVYLGHDFNSVGPSSVITVSQWKLARDIRLLTPGIDPLPDDCNNISYSDCIANLSSFEDPNQIIDNPVSIDLLSNPPMNLGSLMSQNVGAITIEWTDDSLEWFGFSTGPGPLPYVVEDTAIPPRYYRTFWTPDTPKQYWPKALKFTFTLYDSKAVIKGGRTFTHIVYLD